MKRESAELKLHKQVARALMWLLPPEVEWTTFPLGGGGKVRGAILKECGVKKGWPDLQFVWPIMPGVASLAFIELKAGKNDLEPEQIEFRDRCIKHGRAWALCRSLDQVIDQLVAWGVPTRKAR